MSKETNGSENKYKDAIKSWGARKLNYMLYLGSFISNGCLEWQGPFYNSGYGRILFTAKGRRYDLRTHRLMMHILKDFDKNLVVDHICKNKKCLYPQHLRVVSSKINSIENSDGPTALNAKKTHCKHGHEFTKENTYIQKKTGFRYCRTCNRNNQR